MKQPQVILCTFLHIKLINMLQSTIQNQLPKVGVPFVFIARDVLVYGVSNTTTQ